MRGSMAELSSFQMDDMWSRTHQIAPTLSKSAFIQLADLVQRASGWSDADAAFAVAELICSIGRPGERQLPFMLPSVQGELGLEP